MTTSAWSSWHHLSGSFCPLLPTSLSSAGSRPRLTDSRQARPLPGHLPRCLKASWCSHRRLRCLNYTFQLPSPPEQRGQVWPTSVRSAQHGAGNGAGISHNCREAEGTQSFSAFSTANRVYCFCPNLPSDFIPLSSSISHDFLIHLMSYWD